MSQLTEMDGPSSTYKPVFGTFTATAAGAYRFIFGWYFYPDVSLCLECPSAMLIHMSRAPTLAMPTTARWQGSEGPYRRRPGA